MDRKYKVYTRHGDRGMTSLVTGERVYKDDMRIEMSGMLDELNVSIGMLFLEQLPDADAQILEQVQHLLFEIGGSFASGSPGEDLAQMIQRQVELMEQRVDKIQESLPPRNSFVLPRGGRAAMQSHQCRVTTRKAERVLSRLLREEGMEVAVYISFLNRLSDYFYVLALNLNFLIGIPEKVWKKCCGYQK